jgi:hypothetical protein
MALIFPLPTTDVDGIGIAPFSTVFRQVRQKRQKR